MYLMPASTIHMFHHSTAACNRITGLCTPHNQHCTQFWKPASMLFTHQSQLVLPSENDSLGLAFFLFNITSCSSRTRLRSPSSSRCRSSRILRWSSTNFSCSSAYRYCGNLRTVTGKKIWRILSSRTVLFIEDKTGWVWPQNLLPWLRQGSHSNERSKFQYFSALLILTVLLNNECIKAIAVTASSNYVTA